MKEEETQPLGQKLVVFPDTNILLHYPPIDEISWTSYLEAPEVELVFCTQVIRELDEKKSSTELSERATKAIRTIERALEADGRLGEGVVVSSFGYEARMQAYPDDLSPDSKDDRIIHSIETYNRVPGQAAGVVTEDLGMRLKCRPRHIKIYSLPKNIRLPQPRSADQKKILKLEAELAEVKQKAPSIEVSVSFGDGSDEEQVKIALPSPETVPSVEAGMKLARMKRAAAAPYFEGASASEIPARWIPYESDYQRYLSKMKAYLVASHEVQDVNARHFTFAIEVANDGGSAAKEVDIYLRFPPVLRYLEEGTHQVKFREVPHKPIPPRPPRDLEVGSLGIGYVAPARSSISPVSLPTSLFHEAMHPPESWSKIDKMPDGGMRLRLFARKLKHHYVAQFGPFTAAFASWEVAKTFNLQVEVLAENLRRSAYDIPVFVYLGQPEGTPNMTKNPVSQIVDELGSDGLPRG